MSDTQPIWRDWGLWLVICAAAGLWLVGWPRAHIDDLFFTGTAIHLAQGGDYTNPWIASWLKNLEATRNYAQPTFLPWTLAGWLWIWGISTASLTGFHMAIQTALGVLLYAAARRIAAPKWATLSAVGMLWLALTRYGMRQDAMALLLGGLSAWSAISERPLRMAWGGFFGASAVATQPFSVAIIVPLHVCLLIRGSNRRVRVFWTAIGVLLALLLFTLSIRGEWREFMAVFLRHSRMATPGLENAWPYFWSAVMLGVEPFRVLAGLLIIVATVSVCSEARRQLAIAWWCLGGMAVLGYIIYSTFVVHYLVHGGLILASITFVQAKFRACAVAVTGFSVLWLHLGLWLQLLAPLPPSGPDKESTRADIDGANPTLLLLDAVAIRRIYDFRPTHQVEDFVHYRPNAKRGKILLSEFTTGVIACATPQHFEFKTQDSSTTMPAVFIFGRTFRSLPAQPEPLILFPSP